MDVGRRNGPITRGRILHILVLDGVYTCEDYLRFGLLPPSVIKSQKIYIS